MDDIRQKVKEEKPLIHCITNPISINQCANAVLAVGARPIMAEYFEEVEEITKKAKALVINLGNITDARMKAMLISAETAKKYNIPIVLDLVGIGCSSIRRKFAYFLIEKACPDVIKGNYSEINALYNESYSCSGIDAEDGLRKDKIYRAAADLAYKYNTIILASGKTDIITDGERGIFIKNGTPRLSGVTGTGCMLGALCGCYLSVHKGITAVAMACAVLGICGELSESAKGPGSFMTNLLDNIYGLSNGQLENNLKMEEMKIEEF